MADEKPHTPEPWRVEDKPTYGQSGDLIVAQPDELTERQSNHVAYCPVRKDTSVGANAARIVSCINGCAGLDPAAYWACVEAVKRAYGLEKANHGMTSHAYAYQQALVHATGGQP